MVLEAGNYQLSADIALDIEGSAGSLADFVFELLFQGAIVDAVQFDGINALQVKRATLSESLTNLAAGTYTVAIEIRSDAGVGNARQ